LESERSILWASTMTITALILVALSLSLPWYVIHLGNGSEQTFYQSTSGLGSFSDNQTWLTYGWLFFGWLLLMSWFANARTPSVVISWILFALAVTTFSHYTANIGAVAYNSLIPPPNNTSESLGGGWWVLLSATALQFVGSLILMYKGFSIIRKEEDIEPPAWK